ncbi:histone transcription regulator [Nosema bombycis CQ1]|uniref:Protein HIR n=1 Tax=Nosema bombycis (strain CQ1 / CVCC 102059) TaxID=578461 RepID=R0KME9_NOSB1|nr:histone transcription regulator [Nosema bombycis CQ1]|eukprot:EOB11317.1 histone transcription regulator [Nosema bombycis CQ1]
MKISKIKLNGKVKNHKSIFSIDLFGDNLVSSSISGDISLYNDQVCVYELLKNILVLLVCTIFSRWKKYCVSYDDGNVLIYDLEGEIKYTHKSHTGDVSGLVYTDSYLVSVGYDGFVIFYSVDGSKVVKKIKSHNEKITGVAYSKANKLMVTQGSDALILYSGMTIINKVETPSGVVLENFFSRMDWSQNGELLACGLMFNNKTNTAEIFDKNLNSIQSFVGHVAPIEVVAFNPNTYFMNKPYHIIVLASQDNSISLWNTQKPFPFLLLKNVVNMPILDMKWNDKGNILYFCSYDGLINKLEFNENELGDVSRREMPTEDGDLFLTTENVRLYTEEQNREFDKKIMKIKMVKTTNKKVGGDEKVINDNVDGSLTEGVKHLEISHEEKVDTHNTPKLNQPISEDRNQPVLKPDSQQPLNQPSQQPLIHSPPQPLNQPIAQTTNQDLNKPPVQSSQISSSQPLTPQTKRKRIVPTLLDDKTTFGSDKLFIFNYKKSTLDTPFLEEFSRRFGDFEINLNKERSCLSVTRDASLFYKIHGEIKVICASSKYLCVYSDVFKIYESRTGNLLFPAIGTVGICFIDIMKDKILYLEIDGRLTIIDKQTVTTTTIPSSGELLSVNFSKNYFIICKFKDHEYFLDKSTGLWYLKKKEWNTPDTTDTDYTNTIDETLDKLENDFLIFKTAKNHQKMKSVVKKFIKKIGHMNSVQEVVENKLRRFLGDLNKMGQTKFVLKILGSLNKKFNLQYFVNDLLKQMK